IPRETPLILTLARLSATKGLALFARALAELPDEVRWLIAGPDEKDGTLRAIRSSAAAERISVVPDGLWGEDKRAALAEADAFCLPSQHESFGSAAAEAACCGVPTVVTDGCGLSALARHLLIARAGDASDLAERTHEALFDPQMRERAADGASTLRERLSWRSICTQQLSIYEE